MANQCIHCGQEMPEGDQGCEYCRGTGWHGIRYISAFEDENRWLRPAPYEMPYKYCAVCGREMPKETERVEDDLHEE